MRIGLCWKGSPTHYNDRLRSIHGGIAERLFDVPGFEWQSLQYHADVPPHVLSCPSGDFKATVAAIEACDLVITVDTSVAHLSGCQNVTTWLLLPFLAEWRWLERRNDSPWYPSMTLYRQTEAGNWEEVIERVTRDLRQLQQKAA